MYNEILPNQYNFNCEVNIEICPNSETGKVGN